MGKNKKGKYRKVEELPEIALRVSEYAKQWPCNTSYIYKLVKYKKNTSFEMVDFKGINFIIPIS